MSKKRSSGAFPPRTGGAPILQGKFLLCLVFWAHFLWIAFANQATAHGENSLGIEILSENEFSRILMRNSNVAIPVFLGCNRMARTEPELPIVCLRENIQVRIERLDNSAANLTALVSTIPETDWWQLAGTVDQLKFFSWSFTPDTFWHEKRRDRSILCVIGKPKVEGAKAVELAECLNTFPNQDNPEKGSTLRISFEDIGIFQVLGPNLRRDALELEVFVTFFAMNVWSR